VTDIDPASRQVFYQMADDGMTIREGICVVVAALFIGTGLASAAYFFLSAPAHHQPSMPQPSEIRAELTAVCRSKPEVIAEINSVIIDNDDALITPAMLRKVLNDVVNKC
jgi:hypothetical protein